MSGPRSSFGALRHRDLAVYLAGTFLSNCGTWFQNIAQALLVHRLTDGNTFWVGVTGFSQFASVSVLAPWSGAAADRFDRRRLLVSMQAVSLVLTLVLAALAAVDEASVAVVIGIALLLGIANAFATPAAKALLPGLVPRAAVGQAIALDSASFNLSRVVGPLCAALLVAGFGVPWAFLCNAVSYVALIVALLLVHDPAQLHRSRSGARLRDAMAIVYRDPRLLGALLVTAGVSMATDPVNTLGPAFATDVYGRADTFAGVLVGAFGVGAVAAALTMSPLLQGAERRMIVLVGVMAIGIAGLAVSPNAPTAVAFIVVAGYAFFAANTQATTVIQMGVDDTQRGRVSALWSVAFLGTKPIASLATGAVALAVGPRVATAMMAALLVAVVATLLRMSWRAASVDSHAHAVGSTCADGVALGAMAMDATGRAE